MNVKNMLKGVDFKGLALQHCEKAGIAVVTLLFVLFVWSAIGKMKNAAKVTPEQIMTLAEALDKKVKTTTWSESVAQAEGIVNPDLKGKIEELKTGIDLSKVQLQMAQNFFHFVDFGGILRQQPEILEPYNSLVWADRGAVWVYERDARGNFIEEELKPDMVRPEEEDDDSKKKKKSRKTELARGKNKGGDDSSVAENMMQMMMGRGGRGSTMGSAGMMGGMGTGGGGGVGASGGLDDGGVGGGMMGSMGMMGGMGMDDGGTDLRSSMTRSSFAASSGRRGPGGNRSALIDELSKKANADQKDGKADPKSRAPLKVKKETVRGLRWVVVTALFPHGEQVKKYLDALHADEPPDYLMVRVERRELESDGTFSEWAEVDYAKMKKEVLDILPGRWVPEDPRLASAGAVFKGLVMPLPELAAGDWAGFNQSGAIEAAEKAGGNNTFAMGEGMDLGGGGEMDEEQMQEQALSGMFRGPTSAGPGAGPGMSVGGPGMMSGGMSPGMGSGGMGPGMSVGPGMGSGSMMGGTRGAMSSGGPGMMGGAGAGAGSGMMPQGRGRSQPQGQGGSRNSAQAKLQRSKADVVQVRFIDYTVEPEHTYQYRLKVVVTNPNGPLAYPPTAANPSGGRLDVSDEAFAKAEKLESADWSEPTPPVYVPPDTEYYVLGRHRDRSREEATLQIHNWRADLADWQLEDFTVKPGDPIGEVKDHTWVDWDNHLQKTKLDFSTQDLLLDVTGGDRRFTFTVDGREQIFTEQLPAEAFIVDRLGDLSLRNDDHDKVNVDRKDREEYVKELKDNASKEEKKATKSTEGRAKEEFDERVPTSRGRSTE